MVEALEACFDILTAYLLDECPDQENWEDFDPAVDELRLKIAEIIDEQVPRPPMVT